MHDHRTGTWPGDGGPDDAARTAPHVLTGHVITGEVVSGGRASDGSATGGSASDEPATGQQTPFGHHPVHPTAIGSHILSVRPQWVRPSRPRRVFRLLVLLLCVLLLVGGGTYAWAELRLDRDVDLASVPDRPARGKGTTYLVVGSDSREGLSEQAREELHTGSAGGGRTDSVILLHTGAHGTTMVSLPRDSWVTVPSYLSAETGKRHKATKNKLNAAYSLGGPRLLVRTVEHNTGVRVDHYAEIGFGGFVGVVDAVGGVEMCVDRAVRDEKSGLDLAKGCHTLDGAEALAFVRQRHQEAEGDLGRTMNQQKFLAALAHQASAPATALNPLKSYPALNAALDTLTVDKDMDLRSLGALVQAMRKVSSGQGSRLNVPVSDRALRTSKGEALLWDTDRAESLFTNLRNDRAVRVEETGTGTGTG